MKLNWQLNLRRLQEVPLLSCMVNDIFSKRFCNHCKQTPFSLSI